MQVVGADGRPLRGDLITRVVLRTDLTPIPATVEISAKRTTETVAALAQGQTVKVGGGSIPMLILKTTGDKGSGAEQGGREVAEIKAFGILGTCEALGRRLQRSIIREGSTFTEIYRSIGATAVVLSDFAVPVFGAFIGMLPTPEIARVLQEEAATVYFDQGRIRFRRLDDLIADPAAVTFPKDRSEELAAGFLEKHAVPFVFSTSPDNTVASTKREAARGMIYRPRADQRIMNNMGTALIQRRKVVQSLQPQWNAGGRVDIEGKPHIIITAAHVYSTATEEDEKGEQQTTLWLGEVVK